MRYAYPIFLDLAGKPCVVFGTGPTATEKAADLVAAGAVVTRIERDHQAGDLAGQFLVVIAGPDRTRNAEIFAEAERERALVNAIDDPAHCRFVFPSVHRQGDLVIAVSTTGKCPALAVRLRERFQEEFGGEYAEFLRAAGELRDRLARRIPDFNRRRKLWYRLVDSFLRKREDEPCLTA